MFMGISSFEISDQDLSNILILQNISGGGGREGQWGRRAMVDRPLNLGGPTVAVSS